MGNKKNRSLRSFLKGAIYILKELIPSKVKPYTNTGAPGWLID